MRIDRVLIVAPIPVVGTKHIVAKHHESSVERRRISITRVSGYYRGVSQQRKSDRKCDTGKDCHPSKKVSGSFNHEQAVHHVIGTPPVRPPWPVKDRLRHPVTGHSIHWLGFGVGLIDLHHWPLRQSAQMRVMVHRLRL